MRYEGDPEVLKNLFRKKRLIADSDKKHQSIRTALLVLGGSMRGVYGGGQVTALEKSGLTEVFDVATGVSTGAPTVAYFLARQAEIGTTLYVEECTRPEFISWLRPLCGGKICDIDYLCRVFRNDPRKRLDMEAVRRSRTKFYVAATCAETRKGILFNTKRVVPDMVEAIRASIAIPRYSIGRVLLQNVACTDGSVSMRFPARKILTKFAPTDLLVLANREAPGVKRSFRRSSVSEREVAEVCKFLEDQQECRVGILWSDGLVGKFQKNPKTLRAAADAAYMHLADLLDSVKKSVEVPEKIYATS